MLWLRASRLFESVVDYSSPIQAKYVLEGNVRSIYGDYREQGQAQAVIELQVFLTPEAASEAGVMLQRDYSQRVNIPDNSSAALVAGWNQCLSDILTELERDLGSIVPRGL